MALIVAPKPDHGQDNRNYSRKRVKQFVTFTCTRKVEPVYGMSLFFFSVVTHEVMNELNFTEISFERSFIPYYVNFKKILCKCRVGGIQNDFQFLNRFHYPKTLSLKF